MPKSVPGKLQFGWIEEFLNEIPSLSGPRVIAEIPELEVNARPVQQRLVL